MYRDAFVVDASSSDQRLGEVAEVLATRGGVVMLDGAVALRSTPRRLLCEIVDPAPDSRRCENEYEVVVENAQRMPTSMRPSGHLPDVPLRS